MTYEKKFKEINNKVYNLNKDRQEPFEYYYDSLETKHIIVDKEDSHCGNLISLKIQQIMPMDNPALIESLEIDVEDCEKLYHKDMKRKYIE